MIEDVQRRSDATLFSWLVGRRFPERMNTVMFSEKKLSLKYPADWFLGRIRDTMSQMGSTLTEKELVNFHFQWSDMVSS